MCDEQKVTIENDEAVWKGKTKPVEIINMIIDVINKIILDIQLMC